MDNNEIEFLESQIIGGILADSTTHKHIPLLTEDYFLTEKSKKYFKAIKELFLKKEEINVITLNNKFSLGTGKKDPIVLKELLSYTDNVIWGSDIKNSINKLIDIFKRNKIYKIIFETSKDIKNPEADISETRKNLIKKLNEITDNNIKENFEDTNSILVKTLESIEKKQKKGEDFSLYTGFFELDKLTDGLHNNELTCIGARPGTGKTAFAINIATNIASKGKNVYFISLEMNQEQIMQRILSDRAEINSQFLRSARIEKEEYKSIAKATEKICDLKLNINDTARFIEDIENITFELKNKNKIDVLIIDYLTLLKSKDKYMSRELEVAEISRKLKLLALDIKIPIIILVQLNRDAENKIPTMANIRESGSIEQNCDNIIFLHNEDSEKKSIEIVNVILEKQRQGATGIIKLAFFKRYSRFSNITK